MQILSPVFENGEKIPETYTCDDKNINPSLLISGVPKEAKTLALLFEDIDSEAGIWHHWVIWNFDPRTTEIPEGGLPPDAIEGCNSFGTSGYRGPCPKYGEHRYYFRLYALDNVLELPVDEGITKEMLETEMAGHVIEAAEYYGTYERL